jgi:hypothetical protein
MATDLNPNENGYQRPKVIYRDRGSSGAVYGLGLIGAWVYYIGHASTFMLGVLGFLKGIVWPAILVYEALKNLHL